jgi:hypothetical protein
MGRNKVPKWLRQLATDVDEVLEEHNGWSEMRAEVKAWAAAYCRHVLKLPDRIGKNNIIGPFEGRVLDRRVRRRGSEMAALAAVELIPLPNRRLTLREQCSLLAAIHDACPGGERINPWESKLKAPEQHRDLSQSFPFIHLQRDVIDGGLSKADEKRMRRMLVDVERYLARCQADKPKWKAKQTNKKNGMPSSSGREPMVEDPITLQEAARLLFTKLKTLYNLGAETRPEPAIPAGGRRRAVWSYATLRPWLAATFPELIDRLPVEFVEAKRHFSASG